MTGHVVLVGQMGAGKTETGRWLATKLGRPFVDSDELIGGRTGRTGAEIAARDGVEALHQLEGAVLLEALADPTRAVIAAAASVVDSDECMAALAGQLVIWVDAPDPVLAGRLAAATHRRDLGPDPLATLAEQRRRRAPRYAAVASLRTLPAGAPAAVSDAFGAVLLAYLDGGHHTYIVERDDGYVRAGDASVYFAPPPEWPGDEIRILDHVRDRVLDVGAGAGRHALELAARGHDVVALDTSPGASEACRRQGVRHVFAGSIFELDDAHGFDTLLLAGHNLALLAGPPAAPAFLARLAELARPGARIVGTNRRATGTDDPDHLAYHARNRAAGRPPGQITMRVRYHLQASPWFDYWFTDPDELAAVAEPEGWRLTHTEPITEDGSYLAVLERG